MLKILTVILLATGMYAEAASAHGGGPAEAMPGVGYTDMPSFSGKPGRGPKPLEHKHTHVRWHQGAAHRD